MITGMLNELFNSRQDAADLQMRIRVGERSLPVLGGLFPKVGLFFNYVARPFRMAKGLIIGGEAREPGAAPAIPEDIRDTELGRNLVESRNQEIASARTRLREMDRFMHLDIPGGFRARAERKHVEARLRRVTLPEEQESRDNARDSSVEARLARLEGGTARNAAGSNTADLGMLGNLVPQSVRDGAARIFGSGSRTATA